MDPIRNPYAPGAGTPPPELAGRDDLREQVRVGIERLRLGLPAKSLLMVGLRGVGKTVLLDRMRDDAETSGIHTLRIEAPEGRSLPALLAPQLRQALLRLSRQQAAKALAQRALRALAGFAKSLKLKYDDIEVGLDFDPEPGLADNGDLEHDLQALLETVGEAAKAAGTALVMFIDELQYVREDELAALITALHRCGQRRLPVSLVGAGLPQLPGRMGRAKSYAERLFDFPQVGPLNAAASTPIRKQDVEAAGASAIAALDDSFFRVRFDRLTIAEKKYLRAMAELGPGPHRSGDIAQAMKVQVTALGPRRASLIAKGMIYSPSHGDTGFTVPMFDAFMKRIMPGEGWRRD